MKLTTLFGALLLAGTAAAGIVVNEQTATGNTLVIRYGADFTSTVPASQTFVLERSVYTGGAGNGWMLLTMTSDGDYGSGGSSGTARLDSYVCSGGAQSLTTCYSNALLPVPLGNPLLARVSIGISANPFPGQIGGGSRIMNVRAQFFQDAAATQPVNVSFVPEPGSLALLLTALAVSALVTARRAI